MCEVNVNSRSLKATHPHKMDAEAAALQSCLAKFSKTFEGLNEKTFEMRYE